MANGCLDYDEKSHYGLMLKWHMNRKGLSARQLSRLTGVGIDAIECHRTGKQTPQYKAHCSYVSVLGHEFLNDLCEPIGIGGAHPLHDGDACAHALISKTAACTHIVARALKEESDGGSTVTRKEWREAMPFIKDAHSELGAAIKKHGGVVK